MLAGLLKNRVFYLANFSLLIVHEIDSAYWKEWELFNLPGGIDLFLILNFFLLLLGMVGFVFLMQHHRSGLHFAIGMAVVGVITCLIHAYFLLMGNHQFFTITSLAILVLTLLASLGQGYLAIRTIRHRRKHRRSRLDSGSGLEEVDFAAQND